MEPTRRPEERGQGERDRRRKHVEEVWKVTGSFTLHLLSCRGDRLSRSFSGFWVLATEHNSYLELANDSQDFPVKFMSLECPESHDDPMQQI